MNGCFARFDPVIRAHGGFIDKFIGDAVMAIFPGNPANAVRAAVDLQKEVAVRVKGRKEPIELCSRRPGRGRDETRRDARTRTEGAALAIYVIFLDDVKKGRRDRQRAQP